MYRCYRRARRQNQGKTHQSGDKKARILRLGQNTGYNSPKYILIGWKYALSKHSYKDLVHYFILTYQTLHMFDHACSLHWHFSGYILP